VVGSIGPAETKKIAPGRGGASLDFPDQKFVLFKRLPDGRIIKVKTFTEPIDKDHAVSMFGPAHYTLRSMKPRVEIVWEDP